MVAARPAERSGDPAAVRVPVPSAWWVLIGGVIGLFASMTLTVEKVRILLDPIYVPSCNVNPIVSCGSVMTTPQASLLGFPNPLLGIAGFTVVVVTGVLAVAKVPLPRWYWIGLAVGILVGVAFVHWLIFQSLYRIGAPAHTAWWSGRSSPHCWWWSRPSFSVRCGKTGEARSASGHGCSINGDGRWPRSGSRQYSC